MTQHVSVVCSFLLLNNIRLHEYATFCLCSHPLMAIVFRLGLLHRMPPQTFTCKSLCGHMFSYTLGRYLRAELLGHIIVLFLAFGETADFSKVVVPFYNPTNNV